jgi:hypothetical protein
MHRHLDEFGRLLDTRENDGKTDFVFPAIDSLRLCPRARGRRVFGSFDRERSRVSRREGRVDSLRLLASKFNNTVIQAVCSNAPDKNIIVR